MPCLLLSSAKVDGHVDSQTRVLANGAIDVCIFMMFSESVGGKVQGRVCLEGVVGHADCAAKVCHGVLQPGACNGGLGKVCPALHLRMHHRVSPVTEMSYKVASSVLDCVA